jgi:hypothetical protein
MQVRRRHRKAASVGGLFHRADKIAMASTTSHPDRVAYRHTFSPFASVQGFFGPSEQYGAAVCVAKLQINVSPRGVLGILPVTESVVLPPLQGVAECQCFKASRTLACFENIT